MVDSRPENQLLSAPKCLLTVSMVAEPHGSALNEVFLLPGTHMTGESDLDKPHKYVSYQSTVPFHMKIQ